MIDTSTRPLRVALYSGIYVHHDAISDSLRHKVKILRDLQDAGVAVEFTTFTQHSDYSGDVVIVPTVASLVARPEFWDADVHVFEFGIAYELFMAAYLVPADRLVIGVYHNITPRHLLKDSRTLAALERSETQQELLLRFDHVACDSMFNLEQLLALGMSPDRLSLLHLPPGLDLEHLRKAKRYRQPGPLRLLFVGRMVPSKGVLDLLAAVERVTALGHDVSVTLAGNTRLSDPHTMSAMVRFRDETLPDRVFLPGEVSPGQLEDLYAQADVLVAPSYHEGYCVTVVEALHAGCFVVAYDAGNLPNVVGDVGALVPTGDVDALADAIVTLCAAVERSGTADPVVWPAARPCGSYDEWAAAVSAHLVQFGAPQYRDAFVHLLRSASPAALTPGPSAERSRVLA